MGLDQNQFSLDDQHFLTGKILIAMPYLQDLRFSHAVIYVCGHDAQGAMGLMLNKALPAITFTELLKQMEIDLPSLNNPPSIHYGGPVEMGRGFVLHSSDYVTESTVVVNEGFAMTATLDILRAIALSEGPQDVLLALGYVGWEAGQLETEIQENGWLILEATPEIVFGRDLENKWRSALASLGIDPAGLSFEVGHA